MQYVMVMNKIYNEKKYICKNSLWNRNIIYCYALKRPGQINKGKTGNVDTEYINMNMYDVPF